MASAQVSDSEPLRALCVTLQSRIEAVAENASAARLDLSTLCSAAKASSGLDEDRIRHIDAHASAISTDIDRAEAQKTARLEAELVAADDALAAALTTDPGNNPLLVSCEDMTQAFDAVEPATLRIESLPDPTYSSDGASLWAVCAPRGIGAGDVSLTILEHTSVSEEAFPMLELSISDAYECRGPHEIEVALEAAVGCLNTRAHLEVVSAGSLTRVALEPDATVDAPQHRIVVSCRIPADSASSDATVVVSRVVFRGKPLNVSNQGLPLRLSLLPADVNVLWETHYLQFGPWQVARNVLSDKLELDKCMMIWNAAPRLSEAWIYVELVHMSNGWFRFERGAQRFIHWTGMGIEPTEQDISKPWDTPGLRPARVTAQSFESTLRSPESCHGNVRFLGIEESESGASFSLCLVGGHSCTFLPDGTVRFGNVTMAESEVARDGERRHGDPGVAVPVVAPAVASIAARVPARNGGERQKRTCCVQ